MRVQLSLACAFLVSVVLAVFSDEAYSTDWKLQYIGQLDTNNIVYPQQNVMNLLTTSNVLGGLKDGKVRWRLNFDGLKEGASQSLIPFGQDKIATGLNFEDNSSTIQIWDSVDGFLVRDHARFNHELKQIKSDEDGNILAVFTNGKVIYIDNTGKLVFDNIIEYSTSVKISSHLNGRFTILFNKGNQSFLAFYNGEELKSQLLEGIPFDSIRDFFGSKIVYEKGNTYKVSKVDTKIGVISKPIDFPKDALYIPDIRTDEFYAFERNHNIEVYTIDGHLQFTIPNVYKYVFRYVDSVFILITEYHASIIDADSGEELESYFLGDEKLPFDDIESFTLSTNGVDQINALVRFKNNTYTSIRNEAKLWTRDAAASEVLTHAVVDLPVDNTITYDQILYEEEQDLLNAYIFRLQRHYLQLKDLYENFWSVLPGWVTGDWKYSSKKNDRYFGFEKYLVLGTKSGRVLALNTLDGSVVWSFDVKQDDILHIENVDNEILHIFTSSGPRYTLNALTGEFIDQKLISPPKSVVQIEQGSFLLELQNGYDVVLSDSETIDDKYIVRQESRSIQGFKIHNKQSIPTWTFPITLNEEIVGLAVKDSDEAVANVGVSLGNRSVLYKYLYPNVAAVAVLNKSTQTLYVHLLDSVTGEVLHSTYHDEQVHQNESINIVFGEHWVVYSYWSNLPTAEQKIVVLDLFESIIPNQRLSNGNGSVQSAFDKRYPPVVQSRSFIIPSRVKNLGISKTKFGVTTKAIIVALENNQLFYIPKYVLNSRRIEGRSLTTDEKSEFMLLPYDPVILIDDNAVISHERELIAGETIISIPTNLESTSIICTYGLDVFCTRISPSSQFDKLTPSFDKGKLVFSVLVLGVVIGVLRPLVLSKKLKNAWIQEK